MPLSGNGNPQADARNRAGRRPRASGPVHGLNRQQLAAGGGFLQLLATRRAPPLVSINAKREIVDARCRPNRPRMIGGIVGQGFPLKIGSSDSGARCATREYG